NLSSGGDGTFFYQDGVITRSLAADHNLSLFIGSELTATCPGPTTAASYDGINSRMATAKQAMSNVLYTGDVEWGLMRYSGTVCPFDNGIFVNGCGTNAECGTNMTCSGGFCICTSNIACTSGTCSGNFCTCTTDEDCRQGTVTSP